MMYYSIMSSPTEDVIVTVGEFVSKDAAITHIQCSWTERANSVILAQTELDRLIATVQG
jgi:hypothetical protein